MSPKNQFNTTATICVIVQDSVMLHPYLRDILLRIDAQTVPAAEKILLLNGFPLPDWFYQEFSDWTFTENRFVETDCNLVYVVTNLPDIAGYNHFFTLLQEHTQ